MLFNKFLLIISLCSFVICGNIVESYKVNGMHCQFGCANKVQSIMNDLDGMKKCEVDFESSTMTVEYDDTKVNSELILSTISNQTTFKSTKIEDSVKKQSIWKKIKKIFG